MAMTKLRYFDITSADGLAFALLGCLDFSRGNPHFTEEGLSLIAEAFERKPKWEGAFAEARKIAWDLLDTCRGPRSLNDFDNMAFVEKVAERLVEAFDSGVAAECYENWTPKWKQETLVKLLREYGIGICSLDELQARTIAIAKGEVKPRPDEPKLSFSSIEAMVACLKRSYRMDESNESH